MGKKSNMLLEKISEQTAGKRGKFTLKRKTWRITEKNAEYPEHIVPAEMKSSDPETTEES